MEPVKREGLLRDSTFQRALLLIDDLPDVELKSVLTPGKTPGTTDVTLKITDADKLHGSLSYDNFGNQQVGEHHAGLGLWKGNLNGRRDLLAVRTINVFPSRVNTPYVQASYAAPVTTHGTRVGAAYASGDFSVNAELQVLDIRGS